MTVRVILKLQLFFLLMALVGCNERGEMDDRSSKAPNIVIILADDLGYSDIGFFGSEIRTPYLDALANDSMVFSNFYASPNCSPTRAMLLTGVDHHVNGLGTMYGYWADNQRNKKGFEGYLSRDYPTIPELLKPYGYRSYMVGKWHLGKAAGHIPTDRGFDRSFTLLEGGASHFSDAAPLARGRKVNYLEDGVRVNLPTDFYSSDYYTDKAISYIGEEHEGNTPFFIYIAYSAVHWPLQVPDDYIDRYKGRYDAGYNQLRSQRIVNMKSKGLFPHDAPYAETPYVTDWAQLTVEQKKVEARKMEIYAGMVENLDFNIGRFINHLKETGEYDNTVILFLSDNGPEGNDLNLLADNSEWIPARFDNSLENMGRMDSYIFTGANWAQASAGMFRNFKSFVNDGGIRVPAMVRLPEGQVGRTQAYAHVKDILPTVINLAQSNNAKRKPLDNTIELIGDGKSMQKFLEGEIDTIHKQDFRQGWELFGRRAFRQGKWKIVLQVPPYGKGSWQLFDMEKDPGEVNDLSSEFPDLTSQLANAWNKYAKENNIILPTNGERPYVVNR